MCTEYHKNSRSRDGFHAYCKKCNKEKATAYLKTDKGKDAIKRAMAAYRKTDKGKDAIKRVQDQGYYRYGRGAIPILRQGAKRRHISFNLTAESLESWWDNHPDSCFYCGISLDQYLEIRDFILSYKGKNFEINKFKRFYRSPKHQKIRWMTIDRINNDQGYELGNMVKACWICNSLKNDFFDGDQMKLVALNIILKLKSEINKERITDCLDVKKTMYPKNVSL